MMESSSSHSELIAGQILSQMIEACNMLSTWNDSVNSVDDYLLSSEGMQKLAANCMLIESIGEGIKKIESLLPGFLNANEPDIPWASIKGMRNHIAHGYFDIDADIVYDVVINEIPHLLASFIRLRSLFAAE